MNEPNIRARSSLAPEPRPLRPIDGLAVPAARPTRRVAVIVDELGAERVLAETSRQLRLQHVPGYALDVIPAPDAGPPSLRDYDLVQLFAAGAGSLAALRSARSLGLPVCGVHHPERHAADRDPEGLGSLYRDCSYVLSPTRAADLTLAQHGLDPGRIVRWQPGVDRELFGPARYSASAIPAPAGAERVFNVLYAGRLERSRGIDLLVDAFRRARERDGRLQLALAGEGPAEPELRIALGATATFLGPLDAEPLARAYASADLFVFPDPTDGFGDAVLEAQASGLPVLALDGGGPGELIESGRSGCLVAPDPEAIGAAIRGLARRATLRERLATGGLLTARERTWEQALAQLADSWDRALAPVSGEVTRAA